MERAKVIELRAQIEASLPTPAAAATDAAVRIPQEGTTVAILGAISVCHLLNDMMQSLIPAIYPILKSSFALTFGADRLDHPGLPAHRLAAAAARRPLYRPPSPALFAGGRHGLHPRGAAARRGRAELSRPAALGGAGRRRLVHLPSRNPRASPGWRRAGATGLRSRCSRSAAMPVGARAVVRGLHGGAARPVERVAVLGRGPAGDIILANVGTWYKHKRAALAKAAREGPGGPRPAAPHGDDLAGRADRVDVLQVLLHGEPEQLLHVLSDRAVPSADAGRAAHLFLFLGGGGGRDDHRADRSATASAANT